MRIMETEVFKFDELSDEGKEKAVDRLRESNVDYDWWDARSNLYPEAVNEVMGIEPGDKIYFNIDRNWYLQYRDIQVIDFKEKVFLTWLGIPARLQIGLDVGFTNKTYGGSSAASTAVEFYWNGQHDLPSKYQAYLDNAEEVFSDWVERCLRILRDEYEYLISDEAIIETIEANEFEFLASGELA